MAAEQDGLTDEEADELTVAAARFCLSVPSIFSNRRRSDAFCWRHLDWTLSSSWWITYRHRHTP